jgi:hypothetical protein
MKKSLTLVTLGIIAFAITGCFSMPETGSSNLDTVAPSISLNGTRWESRIVIFGMKQLIVFVDDTNVINNALGTEYKETYTVKGNIITIINTDLKSKSIYTVSGNILKDKNGTEFVKL